MNLFIIVIIYRDRMFFQCAATAWIIIPLRLFLMPPSSPLLQFIRQFLGLFRP